MTSLPASLTPSDEVLLVRLAREIAINFHDTEEILDRNKVSNETWDRIKVHPRFLQAIEAEATAWNGTLNTAERTKLKASAVIEEWLAAAHARLHDPKESLDHVTKLATLIARIAGMGLTGAGIENAPGERFSVTINLGADSQLKFEKQIAAPVIEAEAVEV